MDGYYFRLDSLAWTVAPSRRSGLQNNLREPEWKFRQVIIRRALDTAERAMKAGSPRESFFPHHLIRAKAPNILSNGRLPDADPGIESLG